MAASSKPAMVQLLDDEDDDNDLEFLSHIEAIEAQALSLSSSKRRRITLESSPAPPPILTTSSTVKVQSERGAVPVQEGAYTAALRGSKSLTWQNHSHSQAPPVSSTRATASGGSGACFKCGKEGHWARDCDVSNTLGVVENDKACPCGLGTCLLLTANTDRNRGRKFFRCPLRQENGGCGFFEWCDDSSGFRSSTEDRAWKNGVQEQFYQHPATQGASGIAKPWNEYDKGCNSLNSSYGSVRQKFETTDSKSYSMRSGSSCFKCGEEGHWARDCSAPSSNATTAGVGRKTSSSDTCYKCGGSGHWAKDCTQGQGHGQGQSMKLRNW